MRFSRSADMQCSCHSMSGLVYVDQVGQMLSYAKEYNPKITRQQVMALKNMLDKIRSAKGVDTDRDDSFMLMAPMMHCFIKEDGTIINAPTPDCAGAWQDVDQKMPKKHKDELRDIIGIDLSRRPSQVVNSSSDGGSGVGKIAMFALGGILLYKMLK